MERLTDSRPKPLIEVAGVPLLFRTSSPRGEAGIDHFAIVTGYLGEFLEDFLRREIPPGIEGPVPSKRKMAAPERAVSAEGQRNISEVFLCSSWPTIFLKPKF